MTLLPLVVMTLVCTDHLGVTPLAHRAQTPSSTQPSSAPFSPPECLACHGVDLIEQQRLAASGWAREVDKMIRWGAPVPPERKDALVTDLAARYGETPGAAPTLGHDAAADVFARACLACHGSDLVEQQRLSLAGWTREITKMTAWGAPVSEADRAVLAAYLAQRFPADSF